MSHWGLPCFYQTEIPRHSVFNDFHIAVSVDTFCYYYAQEATPPLPSRDSVGSSPEFFDWRIFISPLKFVGRYPRLRNGLFRTGQFLLELDSNTVRWCWCRLALWSGQLTSPVAHVSRSRTFVWKHELLCGFLSYSSNAPAETAAAVSDVNLALNGITTLNR